MGSAIRPYDGGLDLPAGTHKARIIVDMNSAMSMHHVVVPGRHLLVMFLLARIPVAIHIYILILYPAAFSSFIIANACGSIDS
jgi:hypothetical protein